MILLGKECVKCGGIFRKGRMVRKTIVYDLTGYHKTYEWFCRDCAPSWDKQRHSFFGTSHYRDHVHCDVNGVPYEGRKSTLESEDEK